VTDRPTPVVLTGTDVVSIPRIASLLAEFGASFERRTFTAAERDYCAGRADPAQHYAARWAAKEAFVKLLAPAAASVAFDAVEVRRTAAGPSLALAAPAADALAETLAERGADLDRADRDVSLSHDADRGVAAATVTVVGMAAGQGPEPDPAPDPDPGPADGKD